MPKGQAPYVPKSRKLKAIANEIQDRYGSMPYDMRLPERHPVTQQFKSRFLAPEGFEDNRKKK